MRILIALLLALPATAQEFKPAAAIEKERYTYGLPVTAKKDSRFRKLNLVPGGWELWLVEVNGARPFQFADADQPNPTILEKAQQSTRVHKALSDDKGGQTVVTVVVRRPGNSRGILLQVTFPGWDAGLDYAWRPWKQNPKLFILPQASTQVGSESYPARIDYAEAERLEEVAAYELRKREEAEERKTPGAPLKSRETYRIAQRKLRLDAGFEKPVAADDAYFASRSSKAADLQKRAAERMEKRDLFEAHRLGRAAMAFDKGASGSTVESVKSAIGPMDADDRGKLRAKVLQQAVAQVREKHLADGAEGAAFCLLLTETDKDAAKILLQTRKAAFGEKEMTKEDLDRWVGILGPLTDLTSKVELKEDGIYRVSGKVERAGSFTLVDSPKDGIKWVFEDKAGLKFDAGDSFTLIGVFDGDKSPTAMPEDLRQLPFLRVVVIR
jgi:hypothetical protein